MSGTLIASEVDFAATDRQTGFLHLPHFVHRSAYGWIPALVAMIANGEGPTALLIAGSHRDEYEGQIALTKLVQEQSVDEIRGRIIVLTMANFPAAEAGLRTSPIDGGNLNRAFPGEARGTPTEMIAHCIEHELMPLAALMVDLHSGGSALYYPPTLLRRMGHDDKEAHRLKALQTAFDLPYAWVFTSGGGRNSTARTAQNSTARTALGAANRNGVTGIMAERLADGNIAISPLGNTIFTGAIPVVLIMVFGPISGARIMFDLPLIDPSTTVHSGVGQWTGKLVAAFGLAGTIPAGLKGRPDTETFAGVAASNVGRFVGVQLVVAVLATFSFGWFLREEEVRA